MRDDLAIFGNVDPQKLREKAKRMIAQAGLTEGFPEGVTDALANLLHLCLNEGWDFDACLSSARMHVECERDDL